MPGIPIGQVDPIHINFCHLGGCVAGFQRGSKFTRSPPPPMLLAYTQATPTFFWHSRSGVASVCLSMAEDTPDNLQDVLIPVVSNHTHLYCTCSHFVHSSRLSQLIATLEFFVIWQRHTAWFTRIKRRTWYATSCDHPNHEVKYVWILLAGGFLTCLLISLYCWILITTSDWKKRWNHSI